MLTLCDTVCIKGVCFALCVCVSFYVYPIRMFAQSEETYPCGMFCIVDEDGKC